MNKPSGERQAILWALERLEKIIEILPEEIPERSDLFSTVFNGWILPSECARISLRLNAIADKIENVMYENKKLDSDAQKSDYKSISLQQELSVLENTVRDLREQNSKLWSDNEIKQKNEVALIKSIIEFRDRLLIRESMAKQDNNTEFERIFNSLCKESLKLLEQTGVFMMLQVGKFDSAQHIAIETRDTSDPSLHDTIAEVFRPGYLHGKDIVRLQEVIVFRYITS